MENLYYKTAKSFCRRTNFTDMVVAEILDNVDDLCSKFLEEFLEWEQERERKYNDDLTFANSITKALPKEMIYKLFSYSDDFIKEIDDQSFAIINQRLAEIFAKSPFSFIKPTEFHIEEFNGDPMRIYFGKITISLGALLKQPDERFPKTSEATRKFIARKKETDAQIKEKEKELIDIMLDGYQKDQLTEYSIIDEFFKGLEREVGKIISDKRSMITLKGTDIELSLKDDKPITIVSVPFKNSYLCKGMEGLFNFPPFSVRESPYKVEIVCTNKNELINFYYQMLQAAMYNEPEEPGTRRARISPQSSTKKPD